MTRARLGPYLRLTSPFLVLHNLMGLSDSGLTGFALLCSQFICVVHEVAGLSGTSCLPSKCLSRSSTFKCHSCHLNELKAAKIKLKKETGTSGLLRRLSQRKAALINECVHMCFWHVTQFLLSRCGKEKISPPLCPDYLHSLRSTCPHFGPISKMELDS